MVAIRRLKQDRWKEYRDFRLLALKTNPEAFGKTWEEESRLTEKEWKRRLPNVLFAVDDDRIIGMTSVVRDLEQAHKHVIHFYSVFVKPEYRRSGIGSMLMKEALRVAGTFSECVKIKLNINKENTAARKLYEKSGFTIAGELKKELLVNSVYYDEYVMEKLL